MAIEEGDQTTYEAMKKSDFDACKSRWKSTDKKKADETKALNDYLAGASEERKLHRAAFSKAMAILKMPEPARGELLFHLGHYLKWGGALDQPDLLPDRAEEDDKRDLRPRHLRQSEAEKEIDDAASKSRAAETSTDDIVH